jgi:biopolymer transport protein ExbD
MIHLKKKAPKAEINLTPLIDMVFLLLIFFLLTANFLRDEGINVHLPKAKSAITKENSKELTVYLTAKEEIFLEKKRLKLSELYAIFCNKAKGDDKLILIIKADKKAQVEGLIKVMDKAHLSGIKRILIATEREI